VILEKAQPVHNGLGFDDENKTTTVAAGLEDPEGKIRKRLGAYRVRPCQELQVDQEAGQGWETADNIRSSASTER
jgi:hypothetical protein